MQENRDSTVLFAVAAVAEDGPDRNVGCRSIEVFALLVVAVPPAACASVAAVSACFFLRSSSLLLVLNLGLCGLVELADVGLTVFVVLAVADAGSALVAVGCGCIAAVLLVRGVADGGAGIADDVTTTLSSVIAAAAARVTGRDGTTVGVGMVVEGFLQSRKMLSVCHGTETGEER